MPYSVRESSSFCLFEVLLIGKADVLCRWREVAQTAGLLKTVRSRVFGVAYGIEREELVLPIEVVSCVPGWQPQSANGFAFFISRKDRLDSRQASQAKQFVLDYVATFREGAVRPMAAAQDYAGNISWSPLARTR